MNPAVEFLLTVLVAVGGLLATMALLLVFGLAGAGSNRWKGPERRRRWAQRAALLALDVLFHLFVTAMVKAIEWWERAQDVLEALRERRGRA